MRPEDVAAAHAVTVAAFADYARRRHEPEPPRPALDAAYVRLRRFLAADPGGSWVAVRDGRVAGVGLALLREGLWGLSLLVVDPAAQSIGVGGALLRRTLAYGEDARGAVILASSDPRALRAYVRAGFTMHPSAVAVGTPRDVAADPAVRPWEDGDHALAAALDRALRGAAHGADLDAQAAAGCERLVLPGAGYAVHKGGAVKQLSARDEAAAAALLRTVLARARGEATVEWLTAEQQWATDVAVAAGLELRPAGAVFRRGETGPFRPYLPSGAYL